MSKKKKLIQKEQKTPESIHDILEKKAARLKLEDTHERSTYHTEKIFRPILDQLEANSPARGFKKEFINNAIRKSLREDYGIDV
ncbi:hypothetical protein [Domibacillus aminovorans]|uniref:Uncharacterized protein n=1 Tax=Domibacillus aminovorans TaxID=29332 RepID=A0A177L761_9BACI|nr:hypothetical protein [Domibacillus aminovorans]OAH61589.1 hypothetical protein AWH49_11600 [Domibacillus aminovorans]